MKLKGIFVPNVTPFDGEGKIVWNYLADLVEYWLGAGVSGLVVNASTGEGPLLSREEKRANIEFVRKRVGSRGKVIAGTGGIGTRETIELTEDAKNLGAEAALVTTPFFFKPNEEEIYQHFVALNAVDLPVILYNVPKFTGYTVSPGLVDRIVDECSNVVGIKDSSGSPGAMAENIRLFGDKINVLSGAADMTLPTLSMGGTGAILAVANAIPEVCVDLYKAAVKGDLKEAGGHQMTVSYVNRVLVRENPQVAAVKVALKLKGHPAGVPRAPLKPLTEDGEKTVLRNLKALKLV
ncbi:MAG TPA: dihydrodipicolinate synthase family protein [Patescibacteria group bacterium]|nr:dihydrodipicolinate synthase family protein [Patescibacteria group bacterium]